MKRPVFWARAALDDLKEQITFIAQYDSAAARRVAYRIREAGDGLGDFATGRPGRVNGSYEKSVGRLPYIVCYELRPIGGRDSVVILRVIHASRDWPEDGWPQ